MLFVVFKLFVRISFHCYVCFIFCSDFA